MPKKATPAKTQSLLVVNTPQGAIECTLTRKKVRNLNLRIRDDGSLAASAPMRMPLRDVKAFIRRKAVWITQHQAQLQARPAQAPPAFTRAECLSLFTRLSDAVFPLFADLLGDQRPVIKVRDMKSRWGSCNVNKRVLTFSMRLAEKPMPAIEYVVLHEYVHFLHPNHQQGFHAEMARLMPDYKQRRKLLR